MKKIYLLVVLSFFLVHQNRGEGFDHSDYQSVVECTGCHPRALPTHKMAQPVSTPHDLPLDSSGSIICLTCHDCVSGTCVLRKQSPELCRACHDCTQGMACLIGSAHLGSSPGADMLSFENCRNCHDGTIGKAAGGAYSDHKANVLYIVSKDFRRLKDRRVVLINGRVKCVSCHNPYTRDNSRLVKSNSGSKLCLSCHIK